MNNPALDRTSALPGRRFPLPLFTRRLEIRPFRLEDADAIYGVHGDPVASRFIAGALSREASRANLAALIARVEATGYGPYAVALRDSGEVIGWAGIQQVPGDRLIELLYALLRPHWGLGYATEASRALLGICLCDIGLEEIVATVDPLNLASVAVLRKLGFVLDGPYQHKLIDVRGDLYRLTRQRFEGACALGGPH